MSLSSSSFQGLSWGDGCHAGVSGVGGTAIGSGRDDPRALTKHTDAAEGSLGGGRVAALLTIQRQSISRTVLLTSVLLLTLPVRRRSNLLPGTMVSRRRRPERGRSQPDAHARVRVFCMFVFFFNTEIIGGRGSVFSGSYWKAKKQAQASSVLGRV